MAEQRLLCDLIAELQKYQLSDDVAVEVFASGRGDGVFVQGLNLDGKLLVQIMDEAP